MPPVSLASGESAPLDSSGLGKWLRELREQRGESVRGLAQSIGVDRANIHRWERGDVTPEGDSLLLLLKALGAEVRPVEPEGGPLPLNEELRRLRLELRELRHPQEELAKLVALVEQQMTLLVALAVALEPEIVERLPPEALAGFEQVAQPRRRRGGRTK
jgi:transcriptional regulator with XRE-family HTH domain